MELVKNKMIEGFQQNVKKSDFQAGFANGFDYVYVPCSSNVPQSSSSIFYPYAPPYSPHYAPYSSPYRLSPVDYQSNISSVSSDIYTTNMAPTITVQEFGGVTPQNEAAPATALANYNKINPAAYSPTNQMIPSHQQPPPFIVNQILPADSSSFYQYGAAAGAVQQNVIYTTGAPFTPSTSAPVIVPTALFSQLPVVSAGLNRIVLPISSAANQAANELARKQSIGDDVGNTEQSLHEFISSVNSSNMHLVWHSIFERYFDQFKVKGHFWSLNPCENIGTQKFKNIIKDSAKVRFLCKICSNAWTSMKGRIMFAYELDQKSRTGSVTFQLFGQQCDKCKNGSFEHAMWYPEEVHKVLSNIFYHVGECYYNFQRKVVRTERRPGKPRTAHNSKLCQACTIGCCYENSISIKPIECF